MTRLLLVRHGETEGDSALRYWGKSDVRLSVKGLAQAERLRDRLTCENINAIYSSDLTRARAAAEIIASGHSLPIISCPELREVNFGELEGLTFDEISQKYPGVARLWIERSPKLEYPGGESRDDFTRRVVCFRKRLAKLAPSDSVLIVAHSGVLRTLICELLGCGPDVRWNLRCDLASLSILEMHDSESMLTLLNDLSHLR